jgi:serine/threonine protein kinase
MLRRPRMVRCNSRCRMRPGSSYPTCSYFFVGAAAHSEPAAPSMRRCQRALSGEFVVCAPTAGGHSSTSLDSDGSVRSSRIVTVSLPRSPETSSSAPSTRRLRGPLSPDEPKVLLRSRDRLRPGATIDRYRVIAFLGEGSMGQVYQVHDTKLIREVALKCINHRQYGIEQAQTALRREAQAMAQVEHPAVIRVYDVGIAEGNLFVTMELARGGTLSAWANVQPRRWHEVIATFIDAGRGLAAAHHVGLVHCDIKPENILFDAHGRAKISDFGLARMFSTRGGEAHPSAAPAATFDSIAAWAGVIEGTLPYMAPEQLIGEQVDARADQFAYCIALWELLCGRRPFHVPDAALSPEALLKAIIANAIDDPAPNQRMRSRVLAVVRRGLAAERSQRWRSMDDLLHALERAAGPRGASWLATWR